MSLPLTSKNEQKLPEVGCLLQKTFVNEALALQTISSSPSFSWHFFPYDGNNILEF